MWEVERAKMVGPHLVNVIGVSSSSAKLSYATLTHARAPVVILDRTLLKVLGVADALSWRMKAAAWRS